MSGIEWRSGFYRVAWAQEAGRLVVSCIFEEWDVVAALSRHVNAWNDRLVRLTVIEGDREYAVCCYQDPLATRGINIGIYQPGLPKIGGYDRAKILFQERSPLFQMAFAADYTRMETYRQVSRVVAPARARIVTGDDLHRQEFYYERKVHGGLA